MLHEIAVGQVLNLGNPMLGQTAARLDEIPNALILEYRNLGLLGGSSMFNMRENQNPYIGENDALPLEYKLKNWQPRRQVDISYFIGDAALESFLCAQELHLDKELLDVVPVHAGVLLHDVQD